MRSPLHKMTMFIAMIAMSTAFVFADAPEESPEPIPEQQAQSVPSSGHGPSCTPGGSCQDCDNYCYCNDGGVCGSMFGKCKDRCRCKRCGKLRGCRGDGSLLGRLKRCNPFNWGMGYNRGPNGLIDPRGCGGKGCPPIGVYQMTYPVNPDYCDPRDTRVHAAQGYGVPMGVPLAPVVRHQYNYSWGVPASRVTHISNHAPHMMHSPQGLYGLHGHLPLGPDGAPAGGAGAYGAPGGYCPQCQQNAAAMGH